MEATQYNATDLRPHLVLVGGGTGGHLFPMLAVAERLADRVPDLRVSALCSQRPIDASILSQARIAERPIEHHPVPAAPFSLRPFALTRLMAGWGPSLRAARGIFATSPHGRVAVLTTSGFVAPPVIRAARTDRVPVLVMNLDAPPGKAMRWVARLATTRLDATLTRAAGADWEPAPPIVRVAAIGLAAGVNNDAALATIRRDTRAALGLDPDRSVLLVLGGSQGAKSIDAFLARWIATPEARAALEDWQILHQANADTQPLVERAYAEAGVPARVVNFLSDMGCVWSATDFAIARAGAGCVAEVWANRVPTVFMPYPFHKDQHQQRNAAPLVEAGLAIIATDRIRPEANLAAHAETLTTLLGDEDRRAGMRQAIAPQSIDNGVGRAAEVLRGWLSGS